MMNAIPVFSPSDTASFLKYFTGVSHALAQRFAIGFQPDEEHLTSLLCELLDERGSALHSLEYTVADLNKDLQGMGSLLQATVSLSTTPYTKYAEGHFTQADLGIILEYSDHVDHSNSFQKGLLVQAKKLFPASSNGYSLCSRYTSFDVDQHEKLTQLCEHYLMEQHGIDPRDFDEIRKKHPIGFPSEGFCYLLYNPPFTTLSAREQEYLLHRQLARESKQIYDYTRGLCLYDALLKPEGLKATLKLSSLFAEIGIVHFLAEKAASSGKGKAKYAPFELRAVVDSIDIRQNSFAWFLVFHFLCGESGCQLPQFLQLVTGSQSGMVRELRIKPPRFILRVQVSAGTNHDNNFASTRQ
jgi:hypothetical protein